jgi:endonuclease/exonuclease/phosphatase family metal-dependent hydrolase
VVLKVVSYNIREGGDDRLQGIAAIIRKQQPDAVALLEATSRANALTLAQDLEMQLVFGEANNGIHVAWLSRLRIQRERNHRLAALAKALLEIEVAWAGAPLRLFATHLASRWDGRQLVDEVPAILDVLRPLADQSHLLVGDLNALRPGDPVGTPPQGEEKRGDALPGAPRRAIRLILDAGYVDCYRSLHPEAPGYTYPSDAAWLRLDYILASPQMAARLWACDVVMGEEAERASDHFPIWAAFANTLGKTDGVNDSVAECQSATVDGVSAG